MAELRTDAQSRYAPALRRRRAVVAVSLLGIASMAATSLLQMGVIRHLPDPPVPGFDSDKENLSKRAFPFGVPDGPLAVLMFAGNLPLAGFGAADRARCTPWVPLIMEAKALADAGVTGSYLYQMPVEEHAWCGYCITAALAAFAIAVLAAPEAMEALATLRNG